MRGKGNQVGSRGQGSGERGIEVGNVRNEGGAGNGRQEGRGVKGGGSRCCQAGGKDKVREVWVTRDVWDQSGYSGMVTHALRGLGHHGEVEVRDNLGDEVWVTHAPEELLVVFQIFLSNTSPHPHHS